LPANGSAIVDVRVAETVNQMPAVHGHPIVIAQILGNLMVNAAEAIQETGRVSGRIDIEAGLGLENGRECVHLTVKDNGNGIDPDVLKNLFGRGFSTKKAKTGGIGLHWSANSIATMGGRMYADSKGIGRGASFHLIMPVSGTPAAWGNANWPGAQPHDQPQISAEQTATASWWRMTNRPCSMPTGPSSTTSIPIRAPRTIEDLEAKLFGEKLPSAPAPTRRSVPTREDAVETIRAAYEPAIFPVVF
jgi:hypothetical protein